MNAVNLIPLERRRGETPSLPGIPFIGLVAALVVALAGTFVYVGARNEVSTRRGELSHVQAGTAAWSAAAARYAPAIATLKQHTKGFVQLGALLGERSNWSLLLGQIAGVMPAHAELTSLSATASGSASSTTTSSTPATGTPATGSGITISGCAATQPVVADTMLALRRLSGVSDVSLSSSTRSQTGSGGATGANACSLPVQFNLTLQFTPQSNLVQLLEGTPASTTTTSATAQPASTSDSTGTAQ
jgi:Tfp pilus assembly protein PilN